MRGLAVALLVLVHGVLFVGCSVLFVGCREETARDDTALVELENLTFVPAQRFVLPGLINEPTADLTLERALVVDRYELSRRRVAELEEALVEPLDEWNTVAADDGLERPAALSFANAKALAEARGMRLLRPAEWLHVAMGGRGYPFPWGGRPAYSGGNTLELSMGGPTPIGTFEGGASQPFGCYDLVGNLWEWVDGYVPGYDDEIVQPLAGDGRVSILGGGYDTRLAQTFGLTDKDKLRFFARAQDVGWRSPTVGARMCADAATYLKEQASSWGTGGDTEARVRRVGEQWARRPGRYALERLLDQLLEAPAAPFQLRWLQAGARAGGRAR